MGGKTVRDKSLEIIRGTEKDVLLDLVMNLTLGYNPNMVESRIDRFKGSKSPQQLGNK